jgi:hypothetical protein
VNITEGKDHNEVWRATYDSLRAAKIHLDGSSRGRFGLDRMGLLFVETDKAKLLEKRQRNLVIRFELFKSGAYRGDNIEELRLEGPLLPLTELSLSGFGGSAHTTRRQGWLYSNMIISDKIATRVEEITAELVSDRTRELMRGKPAGV